jgi:hypothetical protein
MLHNPKYAGFPVYGRCSRKFDGPKKLIPTHQWIFGPKFQSIIDERTFQLAQERLNNKPSKLSEEQLLDALRRILECHGKVTLRFLKNTPDAPFHFAYKRRFGGLKAAYNAIGYDAGNSLVRVERRHEMQHLRRELMEQFVAASHGRVTIERGRTRHRLRVRGGPLLSVVTRRSIVRRDRKPHWSLEFPRPGRRLVTVLALMHAENERVERLYLVPNTSYPHKKIVLSLG